MSVQVTRRLLFSFKHGCRAPIFEPTKGVIERATIVGEAPPILEAAKEAGRIFVGELKIKGVNGTTSTCRAAATMFLCALYLNIGAHSSPCTSHPCPQNYQARNLSHCLLGLGLGCYSELLHCFLNINF